MIRIGSIAKWAATTAIACAAAQVIADGKVFSQTTAKPTMPYQRAFISFLDGKETLIVQPTLNAPQGEYAWVIPVPTKPTEVRASSTGAFQTLDRQMQPKAGKADPLPGVLYFVAPLALFTLLYRRKGATVIELLLGSAAVSVMTFIAFVLFAPVYASRTKSDGSADSTTTVVGSYKIAVTPEVDDPAGWLGSQGFVVPDSARDVMRRYRDEKWTFVAARLRHEKARPHPLEMTFPVDRPVYPMRLTGTDDRDLVVDLFVHADRQARADHMRVWFSRPVGPWIAHPRLLPHLRGGMCLTRLRGTFTPADMRKDIRFDWAPMTDYRAVVWSPEEAWKYVASLTGIVFCAVFWFSSLVSAGRASPISWPLRLGVALASGLLVGSIANSRTERVPIESAGERTVSADQLSHVVSTMKNHPWSSKEIRSLLADYPEVDTYGGYTLERLGPILILATYSENGGPHYNCLFSEEVLPFQWELSAP
jgi:hypothetical protein